MPKKKMTKKSCTFDRDAYVKSTEEIAKNRASNVGWDSMEDEINFFMGASSIFFACERQDEIPASWMLGGMLNKSVIKRKYPKKRRR